METQAGWKTLARWAAMAALGIALLGAPALAVIATPVPTLTVAVRDTLRGGTENIVFSGIVTIAAKVIEDPQFRSAPMLELIIDFSKLSGTGVSSGKKYVTSAQTVLHRPLLVSDPIEASFPYHPDNNLLLARTALASFSVSFRPPAQLAVTSKLSAP